jgi:hypothetical protein
MAGRDDHIKPLRLYDLSQAEGRHSGFKLTPEEQQHFKECEECQHVVAVFARQFSPQKPPHDKPNDAA